ncbi:hypothetical protein CEUSTIGMA_g13317.t1 [Chlamydomonas eustigma]|uniref:Uncharacterized protein n=1 Tax=Chlamydomonas eustigma TaxID=1157962 RepID=A0A250XS33_9CHLO|nr:hypothetical protein CEUSTIGMA_g13317.t1 [Chlamydomonas eustigma]|eukprot:GAX85901.1 hypothetical protein CEUSTIGMA_g13317.t1 [Chlamydomonas eustigma]
MKLVVRPKWVIGSVLAGIVLRLLLGDNARAKVEKKNKRHETQIRDSSNLKLYNINRELAGTWVKDVGRSSSLDEACKVMQLNGVVRLAVRLVKGLEIKVTDPKPQNKESASFPTARSNIPATSVTKEFNAVEAQPTFEMAVFSAIPWFKVRERYQLYGTPSTCRRRDLRRGGHVGSATVTPDGGVRLQLEWGAPLGGRGVDEISMMSDNTNELLVKSELKLDNGQVGRFHAVYTRRRGTGAATE